MSIIGKTTPFQTLKRKDVLQQKSSGVGYNNIAFAHQAASGDTGIDLTSLRVPSTGFNNPSPQQLLNANIGFYANNLMLMSSLRGLLMPTISYQTSGAQRINFVGFTALQDEIFHGVIMANPRSGLRAVDARSIGVTGSLAVAATDFNIGSLFKVNDNSTQQVGQLLVYRNGVQQFRCVGNVLTGEGNFIELDQGSGYGQVIRFKQATIGPDADSIMAVSNGLIAEKPDASQLAEVERVAGQIERMIPYVAQTAGVPEGDLRVYNPTNTDLKSFGDTVLTNSARITALETAKVVFARASSNLGSSIPTGTTTTVINFNVVEADPFGCITTGASWKFTAPVSGLYEVTSHILYASSAFTVNTNLRLVLQKGFADNQRLGHTAIQASNTFSPATQGTSQIQLQAGEFISVGSFHGEAGSKSLDSNSALTFICVSRVGSI